MVLAVGETLTEDPVCPVLQVIVPTEQEADKVVLWPEVMLLEEAETLLGLGGVLHPVPPEVVR